MSLDIWFEADVVRILAALMQAGNRDISNPTLRQVCLNALSDVAVAFGLQPPRLQESEQCGQLDSIGPERRTS